MDSISTNLIVYLAFFIVIDVLFFIYSFLESMDWITVEWVVSGRYTIEQAKEKLDYTVERIRPSLALAAALPLYETALKTLQSAQNTTIDLEERRRLASSRNMLLGLNK